MENIDELYNPFDEEMRQAKQMQALFDRCVAVRFDTGLPNEICTKS